MSRIVTSAVAHGRTHDPDPRLHPGRRAGAAGAPAPDEPAGAARPVLLRGGVSKTRWASQPIGGTCAPGVLPDPQISNAGQFCDDPFKDGNMGTGAIILNASKTNDAYLQRWSNGSDVISTIRGFFSTQGDLQPPFPGYTTYLGSDGILLRNRPGSISTAELSEVDQLYNPTTGDRVVGYPGMLSGYVAGDFEGWTFNSSVVDPGLPTRTAFGMYRKATDLVSTIGPATGYTTVAPMAYVTTP